MKISIAKVLLMLLLCIDATIPEDIKIARFIPDEGKDPWKQSTDMFNIPRSACEDADCFVCNTGQTINDHHYNCSCPKDSATLMYHDHDETWKCRENEEVRQQLGCVENNNFKGERTTDGLRALKPELLRETKIKRQDDCAQNISSSWYSGCHGEQLSISGSTSVFNLRWESSKCWIEVLDVEPIELFKGRVINLGIKWTTNPDKDACLLFKLEGTISCPVDKPPVIVPAASSTDNPSRVKISPTSTRSTILAEKASKQTTESPQPSSGIKIKTHDDDNSSPPLGLIIGVTVSIVTMLLLVAAFFFYRRHKSTREDTYRNTSDPIKENTSERRMQAKGVFQPEAQNGDVTNSNTDQRSSKSAGVYASLSVPEGRNMYGHRNEHGQLNNTLQEHSLDNKEDGYRYGSITADPPVYHTLEDQPSEYPEKAENYGPTKTDPVYNVLEKTFPGGSERSECYGTIPVDEPYYNTLEESNSTDGPPSKNSEPVYNTLEESHPDENYHNNSRGLQDPVYNILEGPVTDDMGSNISEGTNIPVYAVVNKKKK